MAAAAAAAGAAAAGGDGGLEFVPILERHYSLAAHFALALRGAARRLKKRRFLLRNGGGGGGAIEATVWGSEVAVLWGPSAADGAGGAEGGTPALRVTYRIREAKADAGGEGHAGGCCGGHGNHEQAAVGTTVTAVPPPSDALELTLPLEEWHAVRPS